MNDELAMLYAKRFIQRRDVKAVQFSSGAYIPDRELKNQRTKEPDPGRFGPLGFSMEHLHQHLNGTHTYGHYILDKDDQARMFAFDIDLEKTGFYCPMPPLPGAADMTEEQFEAAMTPIRLGNPLDPADKTLRLAWLDRAHPARNWLKYQMSMLAHKFTKVIQEQTPFGTASAYSGNKGIHVYGFTGPMPASEVREAALFVLDYMNEWQVHKGQHFFKHKIESPELGFQNFGVEVFPKQDSLEGKDLGNLLRLPLGRNLKTEDPTFFLDLTAPIGVLAPHPNPVKLLETGNPYL